METKTHLGQHLNREIEPQHGNAFYESCLVDDYCSGKEPNDERISTADKSVEQADTLGLYMRNVGRHKLLTAKVEIELARL